MIKTVDNGELLRKKIDFEGGFKNVNPSSI